MCVVMMYSKDLVVFLFPGSGGLVCTEAISIDAEWELSDAPLSHFEDALYDESFVKRELPFALSQHSEVS